MSNIVFAARCSNCGALILESVSVYKPIKGPEKVSPEYCTVCHESFQKVIYPRTKEVIHYEKHTGV